MRRQEFIEHLRFYYHPSLREQFKRDGLGERWARTYRQLFDDRDLEIYRNQCERGYHFFEWLAAILIHEATGYCSFVEKYGCETHPRKCPVFERLVPQQVQDLEASGWPDLFCYSKDENDWYFCEVKGAKDKLRDIQIDTFRELYRLTGRPVRVLSLQDVTRSGR